MNTTTSPTDHTDSRVSVPEASVQPANRAIFFIVVGCAVMFLILHLGLTWLDGKADATWSRIGVTAVMLTVALIFQRLVFKVGPGKALRMLGYGPVDLRAVLVAAIISVVLLSYFPIFTALTGVSIRLNKDWLWMLLGIVAVQGFSEETLFRGYVFGNLRKLGIPFRRSGFISMAVFALVHLVLFTQFPFIVALLSTLVALAYAFPTAYLFERGNRTIWAPVLLHITTSAIRLVDIPEASYMLAASVWIGIQLIIPFLVYAFLGNLLKQRTSGTD